MEINELTAISPLDGRYRSKTKELGEYFSEYALIRYRTMVEIEYFIALCKLPLPQLKETNSEIYPSLREIYEKFSLKDAQKVKDIEKVTNHDVKAVEYFLKDKFEKLGLEKYKEFIHFGLTSQDINNTATPASLRDGINNVYYPLLEDVIDKLSQYAESWADIPMLARTHGQPASPTRLGKELRVFVERLNNQLILLKKISCVAKFGGATGNFNAHKIAYSGINWIEFANNFIFDILNLERAQTTTQIEHYDNFGAIFDNIKRINTVLIDLCRDMWMYISMDYFKQRIKANEVGSSAMPHKVNPIDFENAEGNLGIANAVFEHLSAKLPISRLQRDLTDSTVLRNIGTPLSHTVIALKAIYRGLDKLIINKDKINHDLESNWIVVSEAIQTILRRESYPNPFEVLKELTRTHKRIDQKVFVEFVDSLQIDDKIKEELKAITPFNYTGI